VAWSVALPLASLTAGEPHPSSIVYLCSFFVYLTGSLLCHQLPERSFHLWGAQMPVCARCTGIYLGAAVAAIAFSVGRRGPACPPGADTLCPPGPVGARRLQPSGRRSPKGFALHRARMALLVAVVPTAATLVYEWTTGQTPANWIRAAAGVPIGVVVAWIVCRVHLGLSKDEVN
jgi:hypothetical protein